MNTVLQIEEYFKKKKILIIDDDIDYAESMAELLLLKDYQIEVAHNSEEALKKVKEFDAHIALIDIMLGEENGVDLIKPFKKVNPDILCIMVTAYAEIGSAIKALHSGAYNYLHKPVNPNDLYVTLDRCFERLQLSMEKDIAEKELKESNELKDLLLDIISHDLKNSAGNVRNVADLILEQDSDNELVKVIRYSSDNLLNIIHNTSTLAQVANGEKIEKESLDFVKVIKDIIQEFEREKQLSDMRVITYLPDKLIGNANPIVSEVFRNYISNAAKYGTMGKKIIITAEEVEDSLIFRVKDYGKTINEDNREKIFTRGFQLEEGRGRGSGLGLSIVKRIADAQNASVWVETHEGTGNVFALKIAK